MMVGFKRMLTAAILAFAVVALYLVTVTFGYVRFDDADYTFACRFVCGGLSWSGVKEAFLNARHGGIWMPLTWLTYMTDISLFGAGPAGHHFGNCWWHVLNVLLLYRLIKGIREDRAAPAFNLFSLSFWCLLFWAIHPQRAEAVCWIAARKELVWSAMALMGLGLWRRGCFAAAAFCGILAAMAKPTAMAFPALALAVDLLIERPVRWRRYFPLLAISLLTGALAVFSQTHPEGMAVKELFYAPLGERVVYAVTAVGMGLAQGLFPVGIHFDYRAVPGGLPIDWALGAAVFFLGAALLTESFLRQHRQGKISGSSPLAAGVIWFFAALLPTLGLFGSFGEHARADRFLYVPMMALPLVAAVLPRFTFNWRWRLVWGAVLAAYIGAVYLVSWRVVGSYRSDAALFSRSLECDPDHGRALLHLGEAKCAEGNLAEGIELLRRSCRLRPRPDSEGKLAYALMRRGHSADYAEIRVICSPLIINPTLDAKGQALEALGTAELVAGEWNSAAEHLAKSVMAPARFYSPDDARLKLAYALHNLGKREEARRLFEAAVDSSRRDLAEKAAAAIEVLADSPMAILFW